MTTDNHKVQLEVGADASGARGEIASVGDEAGKMAQKVQEALKRAGEDFDGLSRKGKSFANVILRSTAELNTLGRGGAARLEELAKLKAMTDKSFDATKLQSFIELARLAEQQAEALARANARTGLSAKEMAFALRGVPAQFTDIFTSLASGQRPLTVLLQQGGQLKDMFGGIGGAAKALGGYVLGLINPYTLAAAAVGGLVYAYHQGSKEADEYSKALILTGNAAGTTAGQLAGMAEKVASASGATKGLAAEALAGLANTGKIAAGNFTLVAEAAIKMQRAAGVPIADTIKQFEELGQEPVKASEKLNEKTNYLTASIYRQIKALEDQGKTADAAALAQKAYADALAERSGQIEQNLGYIEKLWRGISDEAKGAWDSMLGVGRKTTLEDRIKELETAQGRGFFKAHRSEAEDQELATLKQVKSEQAQLATLQAERAKQAKATIEWEKDGAQFLGKRAQMEAEITKARNLGVAAGLSEVEIEQRLVNIREKYKEKKQESVSEYDKIIEKIRERTAAEEAQATVGRKLYEEEKFHLSILAELAKHAGKITEAERQRAQAEAELTGIRIKNNRLKEEEDKWNKELADSRAKDAAAATAEAESLNAKIKATEEENKLIGLTPEQIAKVTAARYNEQISLKEAQADLLRGNEARKGELYAIEQQIEALHRLRNATLDGIGKKAALKQAQETAKEWEKVYENIERGLVDALFRGFESGKSFLQSFRDTIVNTFKTMVLQIAVRPILQPMYAGMAGMFGVDMGAAGGSWANLAGAGNSAYNMFGGGGNFYNSFATSGFGQSIGLSSMVPGIFEEAAALGVGDLIGGGGAALTGLGTALPYIGTALAIASLLGAFDSGGGPKIEGNAIGQFTGGGFGILNTGLPGTAPYGDGDWGRPGGDAPRIGKIVTSLSSDVEKFIEAMGGVTDGLSLFLGFNSDPSGDAPDGVASGVKDAAGNWIYHNVHDVGRGEADEALLVESKKLMLASVQAADGIDAIYKAIAAGVDLTSASADDIDLVIGQLATAQTALKDAVALFGTELSVGLLERIAETGETIGDTITRITEEFTGLRAALDAAKARVASLSATLYGLSHGQNDFNAAITKALYGLGASETIGAGALKANITLDLAQIRQLTAAGDTAGAIGAVNTGVSDVGAWLAARTEKINAELAAAAKAVQDQLAAELKGIEAQKTAIALRMDGLEAERDAIERATDTRIAGLEKELDIAREWEGVLESASAQIKQMLTSLDNPADAAERLRYAQQEADNLRARYLAASGAERAALAQDYLAALNDELKTAQGIYDRPSNEYGAIFDDILAEIRMVQGDAGANTRDAGEIQASIEQLNQEQVDRLAAIDDALRDLAQEQTRLDRQAAELQAAADEQLIALQEAANAQLAAAQAEAVRYYQQLRDIGNSLYEQLKAQTRNDLDLARSQLVTAQAELDVAIASLETEKAILAALTATTATTATAVDGSHAGGLDYVPYDGYIARLHRGEKVLTAAEASGGGKTITINVPVTVTGASDPRAAAAEMERAVLRLVPVLKEKLANA